MLFETRIRSPPVARIKILEFPDGSREEAAAKRAVRHKRDAQFATRHQHTVRRHVTRPKRIFTLQSCNRMDLRGSPHRSRSRLGQAERSHLARRNEFGHRANGFLDGNVRIYSMLIVNVDGLDAQPAKARVARAADIFGRAIDAPNCIGTDTEAKLRSYDDAVARNLAQETSKQFLVLVRAVDFGRIQEVATEFHISAENFE